MRLIYGRSWKFNDLLFFGQSVVSRWQPPPTHLNDSQVPRRSKGSFLRYPLTMICEADNAISVPNDASCDLAVPVLTCNLKALNPLNLWMSRMLSLHFFQILFVGMDLRGSFRSTSSTSLCFFIKLAGFPSFCHRFCHPFDHWTHILTMKSPQPQPWGDSLATRLAQLSPQQRLALQELLEVAEKAWAMPGMPSNAIENHKDHGWKMLKAWKHPSTPSHTCTILSKKV